MRRPDAAVRCAADLDAPRPLRVDDVRNDLDQVAIVMREDFAAEPPDHVLGPQTAQALERRADDEEAPVDRLAARIAHQLANREALLHRLEQPAVPGLALAQRRLGARLLGRRPGPLGDLANQLALRLDPGAGRGRVDAEAGDPVAVLDEDHVHERPHVDGVEGGERRFGDARIAPHVVDRHHPAAPALVDQAAEGRQRQPIGKRRHAVRVAAAHHRAVPVDLGVAAAVHAEVGAEQPGRFGLHRPRVRQRAQGVHEPDDEGVAVVPEPGGGHAPSLRPWSGAAFGLSPSTNGHSTPAGVAIGVGRREAPAVRKRPPRRCVEHAHSGLCSTCVVALGPFPGCGGRGWHDCPSTAAIGRTSRGPPTSGAGRGFTRRPASRRRIDEAAPGPAPDWGIARGRTRHPGSRGRREPAAAVAGEGAERRRHRRLPHRRHRRLRRLERRLVCRPAARGDPGGDGRHRVHPGPILPAGLASGRPRGAHASRVARCGGLPGTHARRTGQAACRAAGAGDADRGSPSRGAPQCAHARPHLGRQSRLGAPDPRSQLLRLRRLALARPARGRGDSGTAAGSASSAGARPLPPIARCSRQARRSSRAGGWLRSPRPRIPSRSGSAR